MLATHHLAWTTKRYNIVQPTNITEYHYLGAWTWLAYQLSNYYLTNGYAKDCLKKEQELRWCTHTKLKFLAIPSLPGHNKNEYPCSCAVSCHGPSVPVLLLCSSGDILVCGHLRCFSCVAESHCCYFQR